MEPTELLAKLKELLGEHSEAFLIMVQVPDGDDGSLTLMSWAGGFNSAMGMAHRARLRLENAANDADGDLPDDVDDWQRA